MIASDLVLGLTRYGLEAFFSMPLVYLCFALTVVMGHFIRRNPSLRSIATASLASSLLFYFLTNFGVWARGTLYPPTMEGWVACYVAALPYFRNLLLGNTFFTLILFGGFAVASRALPVLAEEAAGVVTRH